MFCISEPHENCVNVGWSVPVLSAGLSRTLMMKKECGIRQKKQAVRAVTVYMQIVFRYELYTISTQLLRINVYSLHHKIE
jgi:hypothetical protein